MSIDVKNQIQVRSHGLIKFGEKPKSEEHTEQTPDEEKSNAAKWMIGLTASAALVIGGLWAAKHGHLGEGAQKAVKKLFGEASEAASNAKKPTETTSTESVDLPDEEQVFGLISHKDVRRFIKNPEITFDDLIKELEKAKVAFRKTNIAKEGDVPHIIVDSDSAKYAFRFNPEGSLTSITRKVSDVERRTYYFQNGRLSSIKNKVPASNVAGRNIPLEHIQEFGEKGQLIKQKIKADIDPLIKIDLENIEGVPNSFRSGAVSEFIDFFKFNYEKLPTPLKRAKFYPQVSGIEVNYKTAQYLTPRAGKYVNTKFVDIPQDIPTEELVRFYMASDSKFYQETVDKINVMRRIASRTIAGKAEYKEAGFSTADSIVKKMVPDDKIFKSNIAQELEENFSFTKEKADAIAKLLKEDMGSIENVTTEQLIEAYRMYSSKFKVFKIDKPELMTSAVKSIKECSVSDFLNILREISPQRYAKLEPETITKENLLKEIQTITGRPTIDENTKLFDILQDLT